MIPPGWTPCRRPEDDELVGYTEETGAGTVPYSLVGWPLAGASDPDEAQRVLHERGLACLADPWRLQTEGEDDVTVAILSVAPDRIVLASMVVGVVDPYGPRWVLDLGQARRTLRPTR